ncbi:hypothetical protein [Paenibacillus sp. NPDC058174]|uniref:hypothetical protein n=1 Tax=Paenibacillus sp. NPDC058174 TaxID=3346366 RepID=UPI0036DE3982
MIISVENAIPQMTSNESPSGKVRCSSFKSDFPAWKSFDRVTADGFGWTTNDSVTSGWIEYEFPVSILIVRYSITAHHTLPALTPKDWRFEGSNDGVNWFVLDTKVNQTFSAQQKKFFDFDNKKKFLKYRLNVINVNGGNYLNISEMELFQGLIGTAFIKHEGVYKKFSSNNWHTVTGSEPTAEDYRNGMHIEDLEEIPESAWEKLHGSIDIYSYLYDKTTKYLTYSIKTDPFTLYDSFGQDIDVLYYSDNPIQTSATMQLKANYSPIDELNDPTLLIWGQDNTQASKTISIDAVPKPQLIIPLHDVNLSILPKSFHLMSSMSNPGVVKFVFSYDKGLTWNTIKHYQEEGKYTINPIQTLNIDNVKKYGASPSTLSLLTAEEFKSLFPNQTFRIAYYMSQFDIDDIASLTKLYAIATTSRETPTLSALTINYNQLDEKYSGLMFMDTSQQYYSTSIGEILKYLDFGTLIAGQASLDLKVILTNTYPFDVKNIKLLVDNNISDVNVEISKSNNPFIAKQSLTYDQPLVFDDKLEFYVRLNVKETAVGDGTFDIKVEADPV